MWLTSNKQRTPLTLKREFLDQGLQLLIVCSADCDPAVLDKTIDIQVGVMWKLLLLAEAMQLHAAASNCKYACSHTSAPNRTAL